MRQIFIFYKRWCVEGYLGYPVPNHQPSYLALDPRPHKSFNQVNLLLVKVSHYDHVLTLLSMVYGFIKPC